MFHIDSLAAGFLFVVALGAALASLYAPAYLRLHGDGGVLPSVLFGPFILSMGLVVAAGNAFTFLFAWELMSLLSFFLVTLDDRKPAVRRAGFIYLTMTHLGTAFILLAFGLLYRATGALDFAAWSAAAPSLPPDTRTAVFLLALIGFGTKAGLAPLHVWLPLAHPVAPSHVSALMSGTMVKTAVYAFIRLTFGILGAGHGVATPLWWGLLLLAAGAVSAVLGVLYALMERDIKRLLAFSTVENIGIVFLGLGAALALAAAGKTNASALALVAALYHLLNHAVYKGLLFMGAGAVLARTHTGDMEHLGGLIQRMPWTAGFFLAGSLAIAALPPFNGFVSEWLTFQSLLRLSLDAPAPVLSLLGPVFAAGLALTGALVAACFVRAFGITFLAQPHGADAREAREAPRGMLFAMALASAMVLALGLLPGAVLRILDLVAGGLVPTASAAAVSPTELSVVDGLTQAFAAVSPVSLGAFLAAFILLAAALARIVGGRSATRVAPTWGCGIALAPRMEYTATGFSKPLRLIFRGILQPQREITVRCEGAPHFVQEIRYRSEITPVIELYLYRPVTRLVMGVSGRLRGIQTGSIRVYLAYIFITLLILLVVSV